MAGKKKKETRIMKVTMDEDEFEKFDKGVTHSDSGLRNDSGRLSALPDIEPISDDELPTREIENTDDIDVLELTAGGRALKAVGNIAADVMSDPEVQEEISGLIKTFFHCIVKPKFDDIKQRMKDKKRNSDSLKSKNKQNNVTNITCKYELVDRNNEKIPVSSEQAQQLIQTMQEEARRLSTMIYILSNICVKDDKTDEEYILEQSYLKQLVSDEVSTTMKTLVANKQLLDDNTATCFEDWLNGYIRNGDKRVPIPVMIDDH